jgi:hypothetical protein
VLGADRHECTEERFGHCNGYRPRTPITHVGDLALQIPKLRAGNSLPSISTAAGSALGGVVAGGQAGGAGDGVGERAGGGGEGGGLRAGSGNRLEFRGSILVVTSAVRRFADFSLDCPTSLPYVRLWQSIRSIKHSPRSCPGVFDCHWLSILAIICSSEQCGLASMRAISSAEIGMNVPRDYLRESL